MYFELRVNHDTQIMLVLISICVSFSGKFDPFVSGLWPFSNVNCSLKFPWRNFQSVFLLFLRETILIVKSRNPFTNNIERKPQCSWLLGVNYLNVVFQVSKIGTEVAVDPHMLDVYHSQVEDVDIQGRTEQFLLWNLKNNS